MASLLSAEQVRQYQSAGILFPIPVIPPFRAEHYCRCATELEIALGGRPRTVEVRQMHLHLRWAYELATEPLVLDAVQDLLGSNLLISATELFAKHPHDETISIAWHRDQPYLGFDPKFTVTAWIALTDSIPENGCMQVILEAQRAEAARGMPTARETKETAASAAKVAVVLRAGEMSLHDVFVLHGSGSNGSSQKRIGFAIRFVAPQAQPLVAGVPAMLARGHDAYHHFELIAPPPEVTTQEAIGKLRNSAAKHLDTTLENLKQATRKNRPHVAKA